MPDYYTRLIIVILKRYTRNCLWTVIIGRGEMTIYRKIIIVILASIFCALTFAAAADQAHAFRLPDTGQTSCYDTYSNTVSNCTGSGQDGAWGINPMSFTDNGDGTITDNNTLLMWQKCSAGQTNESVCDSSPTAYNWFQAMGMSDDTYNPSGSFTDVCGSLTLGGHNDWRLPAAKELMSIVDYSIPYPGPAVKGEYFPNTSASNYWSSTEMAPSGHSHRWALNFTDGYLMHANSPLTYYVRCVRGADPTQVLVDNGDGTVTDNRTTLMWQQAEPGKMYWGTAVSYCKNSTLANKSGWRLPNVKELQSLVDYTRTYPAFDTTAFPNVGSTYTAYWASTTDAYTTSDAWYVSAVDGQVYTWVEKASNQYYVRCVRGGLLVDFARIMRGGGELARYSVLQTAYNSASDGDIIQVQAVDTGEQLVLSGGVSVSLTGGYDAAFSSAADFTTVSGLSIGGSGTVTMANVIIR
jgi:hypothetical protein